MRLRSSFWIAGPVFLIPFVGYAQAPTGNQTTNGNCSPIFNGNGNTNNCNFPPGDRMVYASDALKAIVILQAQPSPKVRIGIVGGSTEINRFANNIAALFAAGHWTVIPGGIAYMVSNMEADGTVNKGEGVICRGTAGSAAFEAAKAALSTIGHPCRAYPFTGPPGPSTGEVIPDVFITIGTRIIPQD